MLGYISKEHSNNIIASSPSMHAVTCVDSIVCIDMLGLPSIRKSWSLKNGVLGNNLFENLIFKPKSTYWCGSKMMLWRLNVRVRNWTSSDGLSNLYVTRLTCCPWKKLVVVAFLRFSIAHARSTHSEPNRYS